MIFSENRPPLFRLILQSCDIAKVDTGELAFPLSEK
jgi:hypothetical protein